MTFDSRNDKFYAIQEDNEGSLLERGDAVVEIDIKHKKKTLFKSSGKNSGIHFSDIVYDDIHKKLFLSGAFRKKIDSESIIEEDSVYCINILTKEMIRLSLYSDIEEGKEGDVGEVSVLPKVNKVYVNSVYAEGGRKVLYIVNYQDGLLVKVREIPIPDSPRALEADKEKNILYVLGHIEMNDELNSCVYVIDGKTDSIRKTILIGEEIGGTSPTEKNLISLDKKNQVLYAIINHKLYSVNLKDDSVKCLLEDSNYYKVIADSSTGLVFVPTLVQTKSDNPYQFSISIICNGKIHRELSVPSFATNIYKMVLDPKNQILCLFTVDHSGKEVRQDIILYSIGKLDDCQNNW